jgi:Uma2 family endonuclease
MATLPSDVRMTLAEFLVWDDGTDTRYELVHGRILAMASPHWRHARIVGRLARTIGDALQAPCEIFLGGGVVPSQADDTFLIPDLTVSCASQKGEDRHIREPRLIVEVVSPSTNDHDRGRKVDVYRQIDTVGEILLVWSDERRVQLWRREGPRWTVEDFIGDAAVPLQGIGTGLTLAEIYGE